MFIETDEKGNLFNFDNTTVSIVQSQGSTMCECVHVKKLT